MQIANYASSVVLPKKVETKSVQYQTNQESNTLDKGAVDSFRKNNKLDADTFKGGNYKRGLKVVDEEILNCKREDFDSDEAYTKHKQMLLEQRQQYVSVEADAKAKKTEAGTTGASKVLNATGNFLGNVANVAGKVLEIVGMVRTGH